MLFHLQSNITATSSLLGQWSGAPLNTGHDEVYIQLHLDGRRLIYAIEYPSARKFALPGVTALEMVFIPGGRFMMGSNLNEPGRDKDEGPQTGVTLAEGIYVGRCEITQRQWISVMGTALWQTFRATAERFGMSGVTVAQDGDFNSVESTGWAGVQLFIEALNAHAGAGFYRLSTEAEWEYFARSDSDDRWSFGDSKSDMEAFGWVKDMTIDRGEPYAHAVGSKLPNLWGLYDVYGNVVEWAQDRYRPYRGGQLTDPQGPLSGIHSDGGYRSKKVIRGGSFVESAPRSADRSFSDAEGIGSRIGFRLVRVAGGVSDRELASRY